MVSEKILLDSYQFGIFKINDIPFLMKKSTYSFYEINTEVYDFLTTCKVVPVKKDSLNVSLLNQLYNQGVLMYF